MARAILAHASPIQGRWNVAGASKALIVLHEGVEMRRALIRQPKHGVVTDLRGPKEPEESAEGLDLSLALHWHRSS